MTLEDFFTVTELENGLTTPTRVNDLITVMQNQKEYTVKNVTEATQQWSAVATTIATTENKECLDLFVQLNGLRFIDKWLNDAQKLIDDSHDTGNGGLEELVIALLRALDRLQVDHRQSVDSGVGLTVQGLLDHSSLVVREKAKDLCDRWAPVQNIDGTSTDVNSVDIVQQENVEQPACSDTVQQETGKEEIVAQEVIMESGTETEMETTKVENDKSESESIPAMEASGPLEDAKEKQNVDSLTTSSSPMEHETLTSNTEVDHALESATKTETMEDKSDKDEEMVDGGEPEPQSQSPDHQNTTVEINTTSGIDYSASGDGGDGVGGLQESPGAENPKSPLSKSLSNTESDEDEKKDNESDNDSESRSPISKPSKKSQNDDLITKRPSDMELDYGMVDPLELARQVAIEVELEVDSQEQSCSVSTSTNEKEHQSTGGPGTEVSSGPVPAPEPIIDSETLDNPASQITKMEESGLNSEKGFSGFDLNEEVSFDETETDRPVDPDLLLTPIAVVSASRAAAAADGPPVAPLQFKGTLGWKGSAATSAFRRIPEGEKTFSSSSSHSNSNQRVNHRFEFDLNVAEGSEDKFQDFLSQDKIEEPSKLQLDLNSLGDSDASIVTLDWKRDVSSSMQPSFRNIDLNLNNHLTTVTTSNNTSANNPFLGKLLNNKRDESVISIFGTQVEVNRKDNINNIINIPPAQPNGRILEPSVDFNLGRPGSGLGLGPSMPYSNLPAYGYGHNGFTMGPMYGPPGAPIPYMVDSRGAPIIPPIQPIASGFSQPTQPFFFNMAAPGAPSGSNGAGPSRNSNTFDLNPGFIPERGNRENNNNNGGLRQFFNHNQASSSSSVIGGKREQPDGGWDLFPINYKHQQPPWQ
ncbi:putative transcription regulator IWS1 family [Helianthus annuus]|uniref:Putative transcription factor IIS n=1 Tax=Helianthus annuus TaxID=4232 RepID=A0A251UKK6_HELAN|nr:uncharacterized protein LOC110865955 [Helianthus annuus]KAF5803751.1 putative transcription regulator IWS1 family [Helianthus annuus]KAJ0561661.1 putative transcription regulator IWS1 family [Helianthus annuus]KAJ0574725.1 putative transcription regulator IWS1 family [Helianthus annuus]KAJ0739056.1 putative transcription regulator IWS1 family [Helianthus annuus]